MIGTRETIGASALSAPQLLGEVALTSRGAR